MAAPRDVMRETEEFEAMREALRRAIAADDEPAPAAPAKPARTPRRPKHRRR
jgi:hypothetical protein